MKKSILAVSLLASSLSLAGNDTQKIVRDFEVENNLQCEYQGTSDYSFCLNYLCRYEKYFKCRNKTKSVILVLKMKSINIPGEPPQAEVIGTEVRPDRSP